MGKKIFVLLVVLMSLSLVGIIFVQSFFINNSLKNKEETFTLSVTRALSFVSRDIEDLELKKYISLIRPLLAQQKEPDTTIIKKLYITAEDDITDETIVHRNTSVEERFKVPSLFFEIDADSINVSKRTKERVTEIYTNSQIDGDRSIKPKQRLVEISSMSKIDKQTYEESFKDLLKRVPIYKRVTKQQVETLLERELKGEGIDLDFEFSIYDTDLATTVQTVNFQKNPESTTGVLVFLDNNNESSYSLYVDFPNRKKYLLSSILWMVVLSIVFTGIIIVAYSSAIYQLIKQRQISQIKTDFINNMTHEFKTPIATINLALDSIKNPKIIGDQEKVMRYLRMIKEENKRMHAQVENVLRISKLEKNELNISKESLELHDIIEDAMTHVELIVEDRQGELKCHLDADKSSILANETHFTNVIVNVLDNAIKYSDDKPKIDIYTENVGNSIIVKIVDHGNGMSKQVVKRVFEKFYREHTGNVHNVKGHGLGLAYVKRIIDDHQGHISVESEKGKGSTFIIKMPLIS
ncbi:sensor histidine kinase [Winogradskyella sp. UBA3174]|uniref:sensor histidine kinase n=1 Tax=Winogradskyella sp. UBA3174 TaxID=1947785 RepID=UPI0025F5AF88|nr:HAMP domain-containing sensor histidine kinase [Winogradskyella sp. UBA3174]|tara:strand:+ start:3471 stop:5042 length:1572 start_codon:yes stop_codon:yes gene_type:complete